MREEDLIIWGAGVTKVKSAKKLQKHGATKYFSCDNRYLEYVLCEYVSFYELKASANVNYSDERSLST